MKVDYPKSSTNYAASVINNNNNKEYTNEIREEMQDKYPETMAAFKDTTQSMLELFSIKQSCYGPGNINMGGNKELALLALSIRMNDKVQRLLNILHDRKGNNPMENSESIEDTFMDLAVYGVIAMTVFKDKWGK
tara:strand:- start:3455 stop:3859 length:405 start_codon:yes stop_codon:yes gene_type:complete